MNSAKHTKFLMIGVLMAAAFCLTLPIFYFGVPGGNDMPQHFRFVLTFYDSARNGDFYPAWPGATNFGFGDAGVRFYPPLAYYTVVLFHQFIESWSHAFAMAVFFWFFVGGLGMFLLAREWFSERASLAAALIFMVMPYHANQVYNAGLFAEFAALAILPFCFLFVNRVIRSGRLHDVLGLSIAYSFLLLSHLPLAVIGSLALLVFSLFSLRSSILATTTKLVSGVVIALTASSFYWVRMISELPFVRHSSPEFASSSYDFRLNFLGSFFYVPAMEYGETSLWFTDLLFAVTLMMIVPGLAIYYLVDKREDKHKITPVVALLGFAIFISTPLSAWLWERFDILQKIQFPWRFLGLISIAGALIVAAGADHAVSVFKTRLRPLGLVAGGLIVAGIVFTAAQVIRPAAYSSPIEFDASFESYRNDMSYECWWPIWASREAFGDRDLVSSQQRGIEVLKWTAEDREFVVGDGAAEKIRVATFYYPHWKATADGVPVELGPAADGTVLISVPNKRSSVRLSFAEPMFQRAARYGSLLVWILLLLGVAATSTSWVRRSTHDLN